ncbi:MAG: hypothetical protein WStaPseu_36770 [Shewanella algae]
MEFVPLCPPVWDGRIHKRATMGRTDVHTLNLPTSPPIGLPEFCHHFLYTERAVTQPLGPFDQCCGGTSESYNYGHVWSQHGLEKSLPALLWDERRIKREEGVVDHQITCVQACVARQTFQVAGQVGNRRDSGIAE